MKPLNRCRKLVLFSCVFCLWSGSAIAATFTTFDYPGGNQTELTGIDGGNIVGYDNSLPGGFLYNGSTFTPIDGPAGAYSPEPQGISGSNVIGIYWAQSPSSPIHSFIFDGSTYQTLDDPLASSVAGTVAIGTSGSYVVGAYYNAQGHGFIYNGSFTTLDYPSTGTVNVLGTQLTAIQGNEIVGDYTYYDGSTNQTRGFIYDMAKGQFTPLDLPVPSGTWCVQPMGISGNDIVGIYQTATATHGFLYDGSTFTTLDDPLGQDTYIEGISGNTIVGWYDGPGVGGMDTHGFIATIPEPSGCAILGSAAFCILALWRVRTRRDRSLAQQE